MNEECKARKDENETQCRLIFSKSMNRSAEELLLTVPVPSQQ